MPLTNKELSAITRKAWRPSPLAIMCEIYKSSPDLQELLKRASRAWDLPAIEGEPLKPLLAHVGPNGNFNVPVVSGGGGSGATAVARIEYGKITATTVTGAGSFDDPYVLSREEPDVAGRTFLWESTARGFNDCSEEEPDILSITRDVVRSG